MEDGRYSHEEYGVSFNTDKGVIVFLSVSIPRLDNSQ